MVNLAEPVDYVWMFLIVAGLGAIGGIAYELLLVRRGSEGSLEVPRKRGTHLVDLGFVSSLLLGAVAAVAIAYFFTPEVTVVEEGKTVTKWEIARLVPLSLIVGSAGGAFLGAMQARILARVNETKFETVRRVAAAQADVLQETAKTLVAQAAQATAGSDEAKVLQHQAETAIEQQVESAKRALSAL